jgi:hypothetical protein
MSAGPRIMWSKRQRAPAPAQPWPGDFLIYPEFTESWVGRRRNKTSNNDLRFSSTYRKFPRIYDKLPVLN